LVNQEIREKLKAEGLLKEERKISVYRTLGLTLAEREDVRNLRIGYILEMTIGPSKGQAFEVRWIDKEHNEAWGVNDQGLKVKFGKFNAEAWQACQRREIPVA